MVNSAALSETTLCGLPNNPILYSVFVHVGNTASANDMCCPSVHAKTGVSNRDLKTDEKKN